ncbi:MAG: hypothetical protein AVDCRST_MAG20-1504, partial [uncultured Acidimicrobiales bacterium]
WSDRSSPPPVAPIWSRNVATLDSMSTARSSSVGRPVPTGRPH